MNDRLLVEALQSRDPGALGAVYDAYADRLYSFCWFQLRSRDAAQVALRDTLIVTEAHIGKLRDADRFGPWLYAIARIECGRRLPLAGQQPDVPIAGHDQDDVDPRIMAWRAVMGLPQLSREILELRVRHQLSIPDLAAVFAIPPKQIPEALDQARGELEAALTAEVLAHEGPYGCPGRAAVLRDRQGELTSELRTRLLRHARDCAECGDFRSGAVSPAKVYGMLPPAEPPSSLRLRVMSCFLDPELMSYRLFVSARLDEFNSTGFPVQQRRALVWRSPDPAAGVDGPRSRARRRVAGGTAAAVLVVGIGAAVGHWAGPTPDRRDGHTSASRATPSTGPGPRQTPREQRIEIPWPGPVREHTDPVSATFPLGARDSAAPPIAPPIGPSSPPRDHLRQPAGSPDPADPPQRPADPARPPGGPPDPSSPPSPSPGPADPSPSPEPTPTPTPTATPTPSGPSGPSGPGEPGGAARPVTSRR